MPEGDFPRLFEAQYADFTEDLALWLRLARAQGSPVLELGCGPGRVLLTLAEAGLRVVGLDLDARMLRRARSHLITPDLAARVALVQADLRAFALRCKFPLAIVACDTFAFLNDAEAGSALACIQRHMTPGGMLALDLPNPEDALTRPEDDSGPLSAYLEPESGHPVQVYARQELDRTREQARVTWRYDELLPDGGVRSLEMRVTYHLRSPEKMAGRLREAGFASSQAYGNYAFGALRPDSPRLVMTATV